ncbi:hypothetical protein [Pedobacter sp.]|jgi:hypothetical protein|uniref:hypothetical protein n=1 Tax=Pedobacter sp. TaxID=1411316 RepID=UPI002CE720F4|nr:hypothetical protein [Pedobacter sp.]HWW38909.1 hypothetical protein [Pedobacter sp.]
MNKILLALILLLAIFSSFGQNKIEENSKLIVAEGKHLYKLEMASWFGTDVFMEQFKDHGKIGGFFSYEDANLVKCIFFSKEQKPKVIGTISFDSSYNTKEARSDLSIRNFTRVEEQLFLIRSIANEKIRTDTGIKLYEQTDPNLIPIITKNERKVYILTGPHANGIVIFGNDYLLTFTPKNILVEVKPLHKEMSVLNYGTKTENDDSVFGTIHSHISETDELITATDICTLMLYEKIAKWEQHMVVSKNFFSIWDCKNDLLTIVAKDAIEKISKY